MEKSKGASFCLFGASWKCVLAAYTSVLLPMGMSTHARLDNDLRFAYRLWNVAKFGAPRLPARLGSQEFRCNSDILSMNFPVSFVTPRLRFSKGSHQKLIRVCERQHGYSILYISILPLTIERYRIDENI